MVKPVPPFKMGLQDVYVLSAMLKQ